MKYGVGFFDSKYKYRYVFFVSFFFILAKIINMDLEKSDFQDHFSGFGAKLGKIINMGPNPTGPKNNPFGIIKMGHVSEVSAAHPTKTSEISTAPPPPHPPPPPTFRYDKGHLSFYVTAVFWYVLFHLDHL